jgi:hypothetical protein
VKTVRALAVGRTESGKSYLLRNSFCRHQPRVLHLDFAGEARKLPRGDHVVVQGAAATLGALQEAADYEQWDIWAYFPDPAESVKVLKALTYARQIRDQSLSEILGGVMIECSEVAEIAGRRADPKVSALWTNGRHRDISMAVATQYPRDVHVRVRAQSEHIYLFFLPDEKSAEWVRDNFGRQVADAARTLPRFHCAHARMSSPIVELLDEHQQVYSRIDVRQAGKPGPALTGRRRRV